MGSSARKNRGRLGQELEQCPRLHRIAHQHDRGDQAGYVQPSSFPLLRDQSADEPLPQTRPSRTRSSSGESPLTRTVRLSSARLRRTSTSRPAEPRSVRGTRSRSAALTRSSSAFHVFPQAPSAMPSPTGEQLSPPLLTRSLLTLCLLSMLYARKQLGASVDFALHNSGQSALPASPRRDTSLRPPLSQAASVPRSRHLPSLVEVRSFALFAFPASADVLRPSDILSDPLRYNLIICSR